ncbi:MAG: hypothetical protein ACXV1K_02965 [Kineosporiaceae bacterium]
MTANLEAARRVADAVLYEGYLLYPYRSTAAKNQVRWQFGVVGPAGAAEAGAGEEASIRTECLLADGAGRAAARVEVRLRFLQVQARAVERGDGERFVPVPELRSGGVSWVPWHEAVEREIAFADTSIDDLRGGRRIPVAAAGGEDVEVLPDDSGAVAGRLVRRREPLEAVLDLSLRDAGVSADGRPLHVLGARLENLTEWSPAPGETDRAAARDVAARHSFVGTHLLFSIRGGAFLSVIDPPPDAAAAAAGCGNSRCWPVLVGDDVVLAAPIILYDNPELAPESPGDLYDATEIDEILTLRIMTLTDDEKAAARGTDARAAAIVDRCDTMPPEVFERLHGALRGFPASADYGPSLAGPFQAEPAGAGPSGGDAPGGAPWWDPGVDTSVSPGHDTAEIGIPGGRRVTAGKGARVRIVPRRRADAQDLFLAERTATVAAVYFDVDGSTHVAVTLEDDLAADLHEAYGRFWYFAPDELDPLPAPPRPDSPTWAAR